MTSMATRNSAVVTLPSDTEILITRDFDAPRHLVYRAYTTPELIRQWWAGDRGTVTSIEVDLRPGGQWRYVMIANGGFEVAFHGEYTEIVTNERIRSTEVFEAFPDKSASDTVTFAELDGRTRLQVLIRHQSTEDRDLHINSGMEDGMQEAMNYLEDTASALAA